MDTILIITLVLTLNYFKKMVQHINEIEKEG